MTKTAQVQTNFTAGELSPRVFGRTDLTRYKNGVQTLENWLPMRQGGIIRRSGFRYVTEVRDSSSATRLIPFEFNVEQTYVLEFGQKQDAARPVTDGDSTGDFFEIAGDHRATFQGTISFTVTGSTANDGTYTVIQSEALGAETRIWVNEALVDDSNDGNIVATTGYIRFYRDEGQLESATGVPTEINSPYNAGDLSNLKYIQSNDVLFIVHPDFEPHELTRSSGADNLDATWSISKLDPQDGPYLDPNTTSAITLTASAVGVGSRTLTASAALFQKSDIGRPVRIIDGTTDAGWGEITNFTSTTVVTLDVIVVLPVAGPVTTWQLGAWSDTTGWPAAIGFFEERLWFAATSSEPNTVYSSILGDFREFRPNVLADLSVTHVESIIAQLNDRQLNAIRWMISDQKGLILMTDGGVWNLTGAADLLGPSTTAATPTFGFTARRQNDDTVSALVQPRPAGKIILQLEKGDRRLLQELFTFEDDRFVGTDMTILADHINVGGIVESALQVRPELRLWLARTDGQLISVTIDIEQQVVAWARHPLGGAASGESQAIVESIATIREDNEDQIWAVVRRAVNGQTKRYVEFMEEAFDVNTDKELAFLVDSGLTLNDNKAITGASQTSPVVITAVAHGFSDSDTVRIRDIKGMNTTDDDGLDTGTSALNSTSFTIGNVQTDTFTLLGEDGTSHTAYASNGNANKEVTTITGLDHLEGQVVNVMVDGATHPPQRVASGRIILRSGASLVHIGLPIASLINTMPLTATTGDEDSRSGLMQIAQIFLQLDRSMGGKVGSISGEYNEIIYREVDDATGEALPLFTGYLDTEF